MNQRQRPCPYAQHYFAAKIPLCFPLGRVKALIQQIEAGDHHAPAPQQGTLRNHQVGNHVGPAKIVRIRLIGRRLVIPGQNVSQPGQYRQAAVRLITCRLIKVVQETQATIQEEQQSGQHHRFLPKGHAPCQNHNPHEAQTHHHRCRDRRSSLQAPSHQVKAGGQAIRQERVGQPMSREDAVFRGKRCILQAGNKAEMHGQIPISALAYMPASILCHTHDMGVLQIGTQHRQRQCHQQQLTKKPAFLLVPRGRRTLIPQEIGGCCQHYQCAQCAPVCLHGKAQAESEEHRQPHHFQHTEAHAQPYTGQRALPWQKPVHRHHAAGKKTQEVGQSSHGVTSIAFVAYCR